MTVLGSSTVSYHLVTYTQIVIWHSALSALGAAQELLAPPAATTYFNTACFNEACLCITCFIMKKLLLMINTHLALGTREVYIYIILYKQILLLCLVDCLSCFIILPLSLSG